MMGNNFQTKKSDWVDDQFEGFGTLFNENPEKLWEPFDCSDFDEIGEFWLQYEGEFRGDNKVILSLQKEIFINLYPLIS